MKRKLTLDETLAMSPRQLEAYLESSRALAEIRDDNDDHVEILKKHGLTEEEIALAEDWDYDEDDEGNYYYKDEPEDEDLDY